MDSPKYQIRYDNDEEFEKIERLVKEKTGTSFYTKFLPRHHDNWHREFKYYIIQDNKFVGCNYNLTDYYITLTVEELEKLMNNDTKKYDGEKYHFYIPNRIYRHFAVSLFTLYNHPWCDIRGAYKDGPYPFYFVVKNDQYVDWNREESGNVNPIVPINEWEDCLKYMVEKNSTIMIENYKVEFLPNKAIQVGCKKIEFDVIKKIWERLNKV